MAWTYFEFLHFCGFFVHQWNVKLDNLFRVGYVRTPLLHNPVLGLLMCWYACVRLPGYSG